MGRVWEGSCHVGGFLELVPLFKAGFAEENERDTRICGGVSIWTYPYDVRSGVYPYMLSTVHICLKIAEPSKGDLCLVSFQATPFKGTLNQDTHLSRLI